MTAKFVGTDFRALEGGFRYKTERFAAVTWAIKNGIPTDFDDVTARRAIEFALDNPEILEKMPRRSAINFCLNSAKVHRDTRAKLGVEVHAAIRQRILHPGTRPTDWRHPEASDHFDQYLRFEADWNPNYQAAECTGFNRKYTYGGTLDILAVVDGELMLIDTTCSYVVTPTKAIQLAALRNLEFLVAPDGTEHPMPEVQVAAVLRLQNNLYALHPVEAGDAAFLAFRGALKAVGPWIDGHAQHEDQGVRKALASA